MTSTLEGLSVLVVEDDGDSRELMEFLLEREGATVRSAALVAEVAPLLDTWLPDVVLTDMSLPDGDGFAVLAAVAARADVPTIALTGRADRDARERATAAGFVKYLTKPLDAFSVVAAIASVAAGRQGHAEASVTATDEARAAPSSAPYNVRASLARLNAAAGYRFTSILRFRGGKLDSVWTFDRDNPTADAFPPDVPIEDSYCTYIAETRAPFVVSDSAVDARVDIHPKREVLRAYCGVPVRYADGTLFGSLCHYDEQPRVLDAGVVAEMEKVAAALSPLLLPLPAPPSSPTPP